jgi:hypothetical protein
MPEHIHAALVDDPVREAHEFGEIVEEVRPFLRDPPPLRVRGIRRDQHDALGLREREPRIDQRLAIAAGAVQQQQQRRVATRRLFGHVEIVAATDATGAERQLLDLRFVRRRCHRADVEHGNE